MRFAYSKGPLSLLRHIMSAGYMQRARLAACPNNPGSWPGWPDWGAGAPKGEGRCTEGAIIIQGNADTRVPLAS